MSSSSSTTPLLPPPSIRQIWGVNAKEEFQLIENAEHPYVSIDTEFPGCIIKVQSYMQLKPQIRYELMKSNVDSTKLIQLGITLTNESGDFLSLQAVTTDAIL
ncbi:hypothetical protein KY284_032157 [Solanum tuberosum]|nr:hypothetical protein KY284_032157 [Solanum tuberosum]